MAQSLKKPIERWKAAFETFTITAADLQAAGDTRDRTKINAAVEAHKAAVKEYTSALFDLEWDEANP